MCALCFNENCSCIDIDDGHDIDMIVMLPEGPSYY